MTDREGRQDTVDLLLDRSLSDEERLERLLPLVYDQLRAVAQRALAAERPEHTLQATALVHEAYMKLVGERETPWSGRAHFFVAASEAMRRILVDHARARGRVKRGGGRAPVALSDVGELASKEPSEILRFDEGFRRLEGASPETAAVVRLRFFAGLSVEQTAEALGVSTSTVDRRWAFGRSWLFRWMHDDGHHEHEQEHEADPGAL
jgi:RNA polymerase sigma factor (TIGR02999 family)